MAEFNPVSEADFARKRRRSSISFRAESAHFEPATQQINIQLTNGASASFPLYLVKGLENAGAHDLRDIQIQSRGFGLHIPSLDADISVSQLFADVFDSRVMIQAERRTIASRHNGLKGGRPKSLQPASSQRSIQGQ